MGLVRVAEGANDAIDVGDRTARVRVWQRPDLSYEVGARRLLEDSSTAQAWLSKAYPA